MKSSTVLSITAFGLGVAGWLIFIQKLSWSAALALFLILWAENIACIIRNGK